MYLSDGVRDIAAGSDQCRGDVFCLVVHPLGSEVWRPDANVGEVWWCVDLLEEGGTGLCGEVGYVYVY